MPFGIIRLCDFFGAIGGNCRCLAATGMGCGASWQFMVGFTQQEIQIVMKN
ncbi:hypothetical protein BNJ_00364 [Kaumoebavirus]|uniref:hypothetical protein n=1 Tax=Kaumoebavirus TaxID=1859492 RepID=UPI0009C378AF|nr:hypothetical protein BNJ_00364 [Kaumoebavirus]ARA72184.1 hypothetical protein BNJ_00364 [Kaumoebavirus]